MKIITGRSAIGKLIFVAGFTAVLGGVALTGGRQRALASAFGPSPSFTNAPGESNCTSCHADSSLNSGDGSVQIMGVPAAYTAGQQIPITVIATQGNAVVYGFQLTAVNEAGQGAGNFTLPSQSPARTKIVTGLVSGLQRRYVEHTSDGLSNGQFGFNSWTFTWTAPAQSAGKVDFYVAGNAANSDGSTSGDFIYTATVSTSPASATPVSVSGRVFTPAGLALRNAPVTLTNPNGSQQITITSSFGNYSFTGLAPGQSYTIGVSSKRYRFTPQVLTISNNLTNIDFTGME